MSESESAGSAKEDDVSEPEKTDPNTSDNDYGVKKKTPKKVKSKAKSKSPKKKAVKPKKVEKKRGRPAKEVKKAKKPQKKSRVTVEKDPLEASSADESSEEEEAEYEVSLFVD